MLLVCYDTLKSYSFIFNVSNMKVLAKIISNEW